MAAKRNCYSWDRLEVVVYLCIVGMERTVTNGQERID